MDNADSYFQRGYDLHKRGDLSMEEVALGRSCFQQAAALRPDWFEAHYLHGLFCIYSSDEAAGEVSLRKAVALQPAHGDANFRLGYILIEQDKIDEALPFLRAAGNHADAQAWLKKLEAPAARPPIDKLARYPRSAKLYDHPGQLIDDYLLTAFTDPPKFLSEDSKVFTMGSCFAAHLATILNKKGMPAKFVDCADDINSTYANRYLLSWLNGSEAPETIPYLDYFGQTWREQTAATIRQADVVVISLGAAPCFFNKNDDFVGVLGTNMQVLLRSSEHTFRTTTVQENVTNLASMCSSIWDLNTHANIVLTVSPIPLKATFEMKSAIMADCISKSILRTAAHEFMKNNWLRIHYWPSFEMVRWCGGHGAPVFGNDDGSPFHVSTELVSLIMERFLKTFGTEGLVKKLGL